MARIEPTRKRSHNWFPLVSMSGLLVSEPVLETAFPEGLETVDPYHQRRIARLWDQFNIRNEKGVKDALGVWLNFVLEDVLCIGRDRWKKHASVPEACVKTLTEYNQDLRPNRVLVDEAGEAVLLVWVVTTGKGLDTRETETGKWRATPHTKLERLMRETRVPFGLLTDGKEFRVLYAPPGMTTAHITWTVNSWIDEKVTLDAFYTLLNAERFLGSDEGKRLTALAQESQRRQIDVADQLGQQVRSAVDVFVRAVDASHRACDCRLLDNVGESLYEMSLTVMMRLIFLLYAEENGLLPHGEILYDQGYGVTHLQFELGKERRNDPELHKQNRDAWSRLLATFNLIHDGCTHPDLNLKALGGKLFDPDRYPVLKDPRLEITNDVVYSMIRYLSTARAKLGREYVVQQVSFRTLDVEQIGNIYEGLIDYTVIHAKEPMVVLSGGAQAIRPLSELEGKSDDALVRYLVEHSGKSKAQVKKILDRMQEEDDTSEEKPDSISDEEEEQELDPTVATRVKPYLPFLVKGEDAVIPAGQLYIAKEGNLRKGMGSYYTPRWVTSFIAERVLEPLCYDEKGVIKRPKQILSIKVCDPAMGSGAFLVQACRYLSECLVESWERQISQRKEDARLVMPYGEFTRAKTGENLMPHDNRDEMLVWAKRFVAEHCLYGVDINPLAVDIARMSLWLATLSKGKPFSFLDHHLKVGNSIIGAWTDKAVKYPDAAWDRKNADESLRPALKALQKKVKVQRKHRELGDSFLSEEMRHLEHARKRAIATLLDMDRCKLIDVKCREEKYSAYEENPEVQGTWRLFDAWCSLWFWPVEPSTSPEAVPLMDRFDELRSYLFRSREDLIQDPNVPHYALKWWDTVVDLKRKEHFFHWDLAFPDVFSKDNPGFDAVIGNPPYVRMELFKPYKHYLQGQYTCHSDRADFFFYFYERAQAILRTGGIHSYISSSTYTKTGSGEGLRNALHKNTTIRDFIDFVDLPVFPGLTTYTAVSVIEKGAFPNGHGVSATDIKRVQQDWERDLIDRRGNWLAKMSLKDVFLDTAITVPQVGLDSEGGWQFEDQRIAALREKITAAGVTLKEYCSGQIYRGIATGLNKAFVIDSQTRDRLIAEDPRNAEVLKPFLEGKDLKPWRVKSRDLWLIYTYHGIDISRYPKIEEYLRPFKDDLEKRATKQEWYELQQPQMAYVKYFDSPKIIYPHFCGCSSFHWDDDKYYWLNNKLYFIPAEDPRLLPILNHNISWFFLKGIATVKQGGYFELCSQFVELLPLPKQIDNSSNKLIDLFYEYKKDDFNNEESAERINTLVYDLYGLTEEEREIVEREVARGRKGK